MSGYSKLDCGIIHSSVWQEPHDVRVAWITMLGLTDYHGHVRAAIPALANINAVSVQRMEEIIAIFMAPDPYSRTPDNEGRRLMRAENGDWVVLNYPKYRDGLKQPDRTAAERKARQREREKEDMSRQKRDSHGESRSGTAGHAYSDSDSDSEAKNKNLSDSCPTTPDGDGQHTDPLQKLPALSKAYVAIQGRIKEVHPRVKLPKPGTQADFDARRCLARLVSLDKYSEQEILATLRWVLYEERESDFTWRAQFHSIANLRQVKGGLSKFAKMHNAMTKARTAPPKPDPGEDLPEYIRDAMKAAGKL